MYSIVSNTSRLFVHWHTIAMRRELDFIGWRCLISECDVHVINGNEMRFRNVDVIVQWYTSSKTQEHAKNQTWHLSAFKMSIRLQQKQFCIGYWVRKYQVQIAWRWYLSNIMADSFRTRLYCCFRCCVAFIWFRSKFEN